MSTTIIQPGEIERPGRDAPSLRPPALETLFSRRAARLSALAKGHPLEEYLLFMVEVAQAQQAALNDHGETPLPDPDRLRLCRRHGMPALAARDWQRDPSWHGALRLIGGAVRETAKPATKNALDRLRAADNSVLESMADSMLAGDWAGIDLAAAPLIGAALQVYWAHMAATLGSESFGRTETPNLCPVCASAPVASVVRSGGVENGRRYLHCSLCASEWHMVRGTCSNCEATKDIAYYGIEGDPGVVKAETCDHCRGYLKVMFMDRDPDLEPTADDLATLALDLLVDKEGFTRSGPNFFLIPASDTSA